MSSPKSQVDTQVEETEEDEETVVSWVTLHFMFRIFHTGHKQIFVIALSAWLCWQLFVIGFIYFLWDGPDDFIALH